VLDWCLLEGPRRRLVRGVTVPSLTRRRSPAPPPSGGGLPPEVSTLARLPEDCADLMRASIPSTGMSSRGPSHPRL
jgi:hypothetical protein